MATIPHLHWRGNRWCLTLRSVEHLAEHGLGSPGEFPRQLLSPAERAERERARKREYHRRKKAQQKPQ